jgi:hypothetical protein
MYKISARGSVHIYDVIGRTGHLLFDPKRMSKSRCKKSFPGTHETIQQKCKVFGKDHSKLLGNISDINGFRAMQT